MRRSRWTIGRMMIVVAAIGLGLASSGWTKRAHDFRDRVRLHSIRAMRISENLPETERTYHYFKSHPDETPSPCGTALRAMNPVRVRAVIAYHEALRKKYERAACFPWLPVEADPSPPR